MSQKLPIFLIFISTCILANCQFGNFVYNPVPAAFTVGYQPIRPFYAPRPITYPTEIIRPTESNNHFIQTIHPTPSIQYVTITTTIEDRFNTDPVITQVPAATTAGYEPTRPFFHPGPITYPTEIIRPSKSSQSVEETIQSTPSIVYVTITTSLEDRFGTNSSKTQVPAATTVGYHPTRPFYHPGPINYPTEIIRPSQSNQQAIQMIQPTQSIEYVTITTSLEDRFGTSSVTQVPAATTAGYQPTRPFYHPGSTIYPTEIIRPSQSNQQAIQPTPSIEYITVTTSLEDRFDTKTVTTQVPAATTAGYQPTRPFFHPGPITYPTEIIRPSKSTQHPTPSLGHVTTTTSLDDRFNTDTIIPKPSKPSKTRPTSAITLSYKPISNNYIPGPVTYPPQIIFSNPTIQDVLQTIQPSTVTVTATVTTTVFLL